MTSVAINIFIIHYFYYDAKILLPLLQLNMFRCFNHNHHEAMNGRPYTRGRIFHLDELSSVVRLERRTTDGLERIMRLVTCLC